VDPRIARTAAPVALVAVFAVQIGLMAGLAGRAPATGLVLAAALGAFAAAVASALGRRGSRWAIGFREAVRAAAAGGLLFFLAPFLVITHRYTDAPPGTELIFFACVGWGALAVAWAAATMVREGSRRGAASAVIGAVAAVAGAAGVLGNWERPSSFSPFVRFASEELWMLLAGAAFIAGAVVLGGLMKERTSGGPLIVAAGAALACATVFAAGSPAGLEGALMFGERASTVALWSASWTASTLLFVSLVTARRPLAAGSALLVAPALLSLLTLAERVTGLAGPQPLVLSGVAGGVLLTAAGVSRIARAGHADEAPAGPRWLRVSAVALAVVALAGMFLPGISVHVSANRPGSELAFSWTLPGWESVGGWAALCCALLLLAAALDDAVWPAIAAFGAPVAAFLLANTPYHVLTRWLSSDIQADFGTEYAAITFKALTVWPSIVAVVGAVAGLVVVLTGRFLRRGGTAAASDPTPIEES